MPDVAIARSPSSAVVGQIDKLGAQAGSSFPSMASVNAAYTYWNQAIALYNRRANQIQGTPDTVSYLTSGAIPASFITSLRTKINTLRSLVPGNSAYTFTGSLSSGNFIKAVHLNELFAALTFSNPSILNGGAHFSTWLDSPYPGNPITTPSNASAAGNTTQVIGKQRVADSGHATPPNVRRGRNGLYFTIPGPLASTVAGVLNISFYNYANTMESFVPVVYASGTDDSAFPTNWQNDAATYCDSAVYGTLGVQQLAIPAGVIAAVTGGHLSLIASTNTEIFGGGGAGSVGDKAYCSLNIAGTGGVNPYLSLDFGF